MKPTIRFHEKRCETCRYFRVHITGAAISCCLLLGRDLGITKPAQSPDLLTWARATVCDGWKHRPKRWDIYSDGASNSPYWKDPYVSREAQMRLRKWEKK